MYQVKFNRNGKTHFGINEEYSEEAKKLNALGIHIISDAVLPVSYEVKAEDLIEIKLEPSRADPKTWEEIGGDELCQFVRSEFNKAIELSDKTPDDSKLHVNKLFCIPVADGQAWYVVTKVSKKTCQVEWRGFNPDMWTDRWLGWGGKFPIDDVLRVGRFPRFSKENLVQ